MQGDPEAEDVAQHALLRVFERASDYEPSRGQALPWMLGIAGWEVKTHRRRRWRRREIGVDTELVSRTDLEADLVARDLWDAVRAECRSLSPLDQETLRFALDGGSGGPTFRKRLSRAVDRLRSAWRTTHGS